MPRLMMVSAIAASTLAFGYAARTLVVPWRRTLAFRRLEQDARVDLAGVATVRLPRSFRAVGRGSDGPRDGHFDPGSLDQHGDEREITFRFEQGQHRDLGAYFTNPVLLNVTLYNAALPAPTIAGIDRTTVAPFYPPVDNDRPRLAAHFAAQPWLPDVVADGAVTRATATNDGHGDELMRGGPKRWLVIHVDPVRRVRVDLWAWQRAYSLDEARSLVRRVAGSVELTPKLAELFAGVKTLERRLSEQFDRTVADAVGRLRQCGIDSLPPGRVVRSGACSAWLADDRRYLDVARTIGRAPLASAIRRPNTPPEFPAPVAPPGGADSPAGDEPLRLSMLYWDETAGRWALDGVGWRTDGHDYLTRPVVAALAARLGDRSSAHLLCLVGYDLKFHAEHVDVDRFLSRCDRVAAAFRAGTLLPGVPVMSDSTS